MARLSLEPRIAYSHLGMHLFRLPRLTIIICWIMLHYNITMEIPPEIIGNIIVFFDAPTALPPQEADVVIVTASALSSRKDAINQGVIVINRETALIKSMNGGLGETLAGQPGVRATFFGPNASRPIIRGLGEDRIRILSNGMLGIDASTISPDHSPAIDGLEAQSVEVLKGAAALRFGANAVGGVVNLIDGRLPTRLGKDGISGDVFVGASQRDDIKSAAGALSYVKGDFVFKIDGVRRSSGDYSIPGFAQTDAMRAITGDDTEGRVFNSGGEITILGASLGYVGETANIAASARDTNSEYGIPGEEANIKLEQTRFDFAASQKLSGPLALISFNATTGEYEHAEVEFSGEVGTVFKSQGYEMRLEARSAKIGNFEGLFGGQISDKDFEAIGDEAFILPVNVKNQGIFAISNYETDKWGTQFGVRSENVKYSGLAGRRNFDASSSSIGGFVKPIDNLRLALTFANTRRVPTEVELFADGPHAATQSYEIGNPNLRIETAKSIELASHWESGKTHFEANIWQAKFDNFIAFGPTGDVIDDLPVFEVSQRIAELNGYEFTLNQEIGEIGSLAFAASVAIDYVRGKYSLGENVPRMPPLSTTLGLKAKIGGLNLDANVQILEKQAKIAAFETPTKGANILNFGAAYRPAANPNWLLHFEVQNATDEEVREHTSVLKDFLPRPGRRLSLSARYSF